MKYLIIALFSLSSFAQTEHSDVKKHLEKYFLGFRTKNELLIKSLVSKEYFKTLKKDKTLSNAFSMQNSNRKIEKIDYKVVRAAKTKNKFFVNTKRKTEKDFDHYWYTIEVSNKKLFITDMVMLEEHPH